MVYATFENQIPHLTFDFINYITASQIDLKHLQKILTGEYLQRPPAAPLDSSLHQRISLLGPRLISKTLTE
jgi:hypothetical protein